MTPWSFAKVDGPPWPHSPCCTSQGCHYAPFSRSLSQLHPYPSLLPQARVLPAVPPVGTANAQLQHLSLWRTCSSGAWATRRRLEKPCSQSPEWYSWCSSSPLLLIRGHTSALMVFHAVQLYSISIHYCYADKADSKLCSLNVLPATETSTWPRPAPNVYPANMALRR